VGGECWCGPCAYNNWLPGGGWVGNTVLFGSLLERALLVTRDAFGGSNAVNGGLRGGVGWGPVRGRGGSHRGVHGVLWVGRVGGFRNMMGWTVSAVWRIRWGWGPVERSESWGVNCVIGVRAKPLCQAESCGRGVQHRPRAC